MADNVTLDAGSGGDAIAADDIGGVKHQRVKIEYGTDGSATEVSDSNPLPVDDAGGSLTVDDGGSSLSIDDGGNTITVDGTVAVSGVATSAKQDTIIGHLDGVETTLTAIDGRVDGVEALLTTIDGDTGTLAVTGGGTEAGALRVTLASDSTGVVSVDDNGVSLTVDNAGLTELAAAINASSQLDVNIAASDVAIGGGAQVDTDSASTGTDTGTLAQTVRFDAGGALATTDGDFQPLQTDANGALRVTGGGGGTEYTVNDAAPANPVGTASLMERDDALSALTEVEGDWTNMRANANGALWVKHDGEITAALSSTDNTVLDNIDADTSAIQTATEAIQAAVEGTLTVDSELTTADLDTGAGTDTRAVVGLAGTASGGAQLIPGSSTDGLLVNLGANNDVTVSGVATAANQSTIIGHVDGIETLIGTTNTNTGAATTALQIIDDWDESDRAKVNLIVGQAGIAGGTGTDGATVPRVTLATNVALPAGTNAIGKLAANSGVDIGDVDVTSISAGTNLIGDVGVKPRTSGGLTIFRSIDLDETEEDVKTSAGQLFGWYIFNAAATTHYVKLYNATAANVTVGSTTPVLTIPVPAGSAANVFSEIGIAFSTAITAAATTGVADADTGAPAANAVIANFFYS